MLCYSVYACVFMRVNACLHAHVCFLHMRRFICTSLNALYDNVSCNILSRPQVDLTFERFRFLAPCQRLRAIVCVLSAHLRRVLKSTCVCLRFREQCLRSEITSVSRVALVLLLRFVAGNMDVNTPASKRSQLIGNTAIVRKRCVIHTNSTCVCWRLSVATFTQKRKDASFDLWPPFFCVDYAALSNNRCVSDQLGTFGRRRIHVHVNGDKTQE